MHERSVRTGRLVGCAPQNAMQKRSWSTAHGRRGRRSWHVDTVTGTVGARASERSETQSDGHDGTVTGTRRTRASRRGVRRQTCCTKTVSGFLSEHVALASLGLSHAALKPRAAGCQLSLESCLLR